MALISFASFSICSVFFTMDGKDFFGRSPLEFVAQVGGVLVEEVDPFADFLFVLRVTSALSGGGSFGTMGINFSRVRGVIGLGLRRVSLMMASGGKSPARNSIEDPELSASAKQQEQNPGSEAQKNQAAKYAEQQGSGRCWNGPAARAR